MPVSSIMIQADRRTYDRWSRALNNLSQPIEVELVPVGSVAALPALPKTVTFTGAELLLDVGRACSRPEITDDPERLFALLRYATKISGSSRNMQLSADVARLDPHKKKVLSDEIGCGFSFLICSRILGTRLYLDLCDAIRRGWITTSAPKSIQPDYIASGRTPGQLVVLEAKGSQSPSYCRSKQIPRGCQQVKAVQSKTRHLAYRIVVGAGLQRVDQSSKSRIFVGDPEQALPFDLHFEADPENVILRSNYFRVASFVGDGQLIKRFDDLREEEEYPAEHALKRETQDGRLAIGSSFEIGYGQYRSGFFVGTDAQIRKFLLSGPIDRLNRIPDLIVETKHDPERATYQERRDDGTTIEVWSQLLPTDVSPMR